MDQALKNAVELNEQFKAAYLKLGYEKASVKLEELERQMAEPDFWQDTAKANQIAKRAGELKNRLAPWQNLQSSINELVEIIKLKDESLQTEIKKQQVELSELFEELKTELKFSGQYDDHSAIVSIFAGAGGTDAQDWAQMLLRMYVRFFETKGWLANVIDESTGDEAGIKSAVIDVDGPFVYGNLIGEHGVHRLVRQSPFNADKLRQTSFARVEVLPKIESPTELELDEKDLKIDVFRAGGRGGQSVNTTDSAVRVTHLPSGVTVSIQNERSQLQNKETALTILRSKLAQAQLEQHKKTLSEIKGPSEQAAWGNQIRNYVLHPYKQVKDLRSGFESKDPTKVLDGKIDEFISAFLDIS